MEFVDTPPSPTFVAGQSVQDITIQELLQQGELSQVWLANDPSLGQVALKIPTWNDSLSFQKAARHIAQETRALAWLFHSQIPQLHGRLSYHGVPILVIQYFPASNLYDIMAKAEIIPSKRVIQIGLHLSQMLAYVHSRGITHRDIKPTNILIMPTNKVILIDFGICDLPDRPFKDPGTTKMGTLEFEPPEFFRGIISQKTDVFAFGATLFMLLMGYGIHGPYDKTRHEETATRAQQGRYELLAETVPEGLRRLIKRCLDPEPTNRPTAAQLVVALKILAQHTV